MINLTSVTSIIDLLTVSVRYQTDDYPVARKIRLVRDVPTDDFASGLAIRFDQAVFPGRLRIVYKAAYTSAVDRSNRYQQYVRCARNSHRHRCNRRTNTVDVTTRNQTKLHRITRRHTPSRRSNNGFSSEQHHRTYAFTPRPYPSRSSTSSKSIPNIPI
jgi:hypothetical protein